MRLGTRSPDAFIQSLNQKNDQIRQVFLKKIKDLSKTRQVQVMMGDSTVTEQATFDPKLVMDFFQGIIRDLDGWSVQDVSVSNNEDIRRAFTKFEVMIGDYLLSGHLSIQFHVLLYYRPDQRVIDCQKELAEIVDLTKGREQKLSDENDELVLQKLKEMKYKDFDPQKLFEVFYDNEELCKKIYAQIRDSEGADFQKLTETKKGLFDELDSMLLETYQTSPVLIDDSRLVTGEQGCLCTFDIELVKETRQGLFDPKKMPDPARGGIAKKLDEFLQIISSDVG